MNKKGIIIYVEDDEDDKDIMLEIYKDLNFENEIVWLKNGAEAYEYLNNNNIDPFLIICDINMPRMNGLQLRDKMQTVGKLNLRTVPFLFLTTAAAKDNIVTAYANSVQGFFLKKVQYDDLKRMFKLILEYWKESTEPQFN